jgi:hypothetical protein
VGNGIELDRRTSSLRNLAQSNVAVTSVSPCSENVQAEVLPTQPPLQPPNDEVPTGVSVSVTVLPLAKLALQVPAVLAQLMPEGELVTVPVPAPEKLTVRSGPDPPLPELVKQTTLAVMDPVTTAPEEDTPPASAFV